MGDMHGSCCVVVERHLEGRRWDGNVSPLRVTGFEDLKLRARRQRERDSRDLHEIVSPLFPFKFPLAEKFIGVASSTGKFEPARNDGIVAFRCRIEHGVDEIALVFKGMSGVRNVLEITQEIGGGGGW